MQPGHRRGIEPDRSGMVGGWRRAACSAASIVALLGVPVAGITAEPGAAQPRAGEPAPVAPVTSCDALATVDLSAAGGTGSKVTSAREGTGAVDGTVLRFCTVEGVLAPDIGFRVRLPMQSWTQRYVHMGCGGLCGEASQAFAPEQAFGNPLARAGGLALSSTDMGHRGPDSAWTTDAGKRADFAYRAVHVTTLAAKQLIRAYYGQGPRHAYFIGCSDGGREGLVAAQRYPTDYDGVVVGAPALLFQVQNSLHHGWLARVNRDTGRSTGRIVLLPAKAELLHRAVIEACGRLDGVPDELISDPRICRFDPQPLECPGSRPRDADCLSSAELASVRRIYAGPRDPISLRRLLVGGPQYGSERNWAGVFVPASPDDTGLFSEAIVDSARNLIFAEQPAPTLDQFRFTEGFYARLLPRHALNDATDPDLSAFRAAGGRLILWHGWADAQISPINTIAYLEALQRVMGRTAVDDFARLYLLPGVSHCGGGEGHDQMDLLSVIVSWVEQAQAPDAILSHRVDSAGNLTSSRPVYPYPAVARYEGHGDVHDASSFGRGPALYDQPVPDWVGRDWFRHDPSAPH